MEEFEELKESQYAFVTPFSGSSPLVSLKNGGPEVARDKIDEVIEYLKAIEVVDCIRVYIEHAHLVEDLPMGPDGVVRRIWSDELVVHLRRADGWVVVRSNDIENGCPALSHESQLKRLREKAREQIEMSLRMRGVPVPSKN